MLLGQEKGHKGALLTFLPRTHVIFGMPMRVSTVYILWGGGEWRHLDMQIDMGTSGPRGRARRGFV